MKCECNTTLCAVHQQSFLDILADIPGRLNTMNVSIMKQSVMGGQGGSPTNDDDRPLPINLGAAEVQRALVVAVVDTCMRVRHCLPDGEGPRQSLRGAAEWMAGRMTAIVQHPEAVHWYHDIRNAYDKAGKAIDLPAERVRAGKCTGCGEVLYAAAGAEKVRCRPCLISYDVWELQTVELSKIMNFQAPAALLIKAMEMAGHKLKLKTLTSWADRGQVTFTTDERGRVFRVGDVLDTMKTMGVSA